MLIRLCWAFALFGATCMAQNPIHAAHAAAREAAIQAAKDALTTPPPKTGNPNIDYKWDPNLPIELEGYDLSNYPFYNGLPDDLLDPNIYNFTCDNRLDGFYASVHHQCQVYHNCLFGQRYDFVCANYTVFSQKDFICQYVSLVDCKNSAKHFDRNEALYKEETTTTEKPPRREFPKRPAEDEYSDVRRPSRPRPNRPFRRPNIRPRPAQDLPSQTIDERPSGGRRPGNRRTPAPAIYDDYYYDEYDTFDTYYYDDNYYYDEPQTPKTTTTTTQAPPPRRRPQRPRTQGSRRGAGDRIRPLEQDTVRRPINRRRPNRPAIRNTTPADPFYDYYDYDNRVSDEPPASTTTSAPVLTTQAPPPRRPTRIRDTPRRPEPTNEESLLDNDEELNNNPPSTVEERRPVNGRRPFRPAPEEPTSTPRRSGSGSVVNARRPFRPAAQESSPQDEAPARESLGSGRRRGPSFPSRRNSVATQPEELVNDELLIEEAPPSELGIESTADATVPEEPPVEEVSAPRRRNPGSRLRVRQRPQRQASDYYYYDY